MITIPALYEVYRQHPSVCTDSRKVKAGDLFFALKGESFDGNQYALQALRDGAAYAVVDDQSLAGLEKCLLVDNVLTALQQLATHHRRQFTIPVLALTGSNGKTTTKELIATVLQQRYKTHFTQGNFNNHIGVPLTLLSMPLDTEIAVIEMGANHQKEIMALCTIAEPTHGMITNIGKAHLEGFGGPEGVKKGKGEMYDWLKNNAGVIFLHTNDPVLSEMAGDYTKLIRYKGLYAEEPIKDYLTEIQCLGVDPMIRVQFISRHEVTIQVQTNLIGSYNFPNVMAAVAIGKYFKVKSVDIARALENYIPENNRSEIIRMGSNTILLDAYNANPSSMAVALENLKSLSAPIKVAILGDMLELGEYTAIEHERIVALAIEAGVSQLILVGPLFSKIQLNPPHLNFQKVEDMQSWWSAQLWENSTILIKGSRGMHLESLLRNSVH